MKNTKSKIAPAKKPAVKKRRGPQTAQQTIPYKEMLRDGVCRVSDNYYTKTLSYEDINYAVASADDQAAIFDGYADENGRKFYTIQTPAGNTFYLVIDFTKETENVYFLDAVAEKDLLALAEKAGNAIPAEEENSATTSEPPGGSVTEPEAKESSGMFNLILIGAVVLIGGGLALYFKVLRKKKANDMREEYEEETYPPKELEDETDLPPWEDDDNV